MHCQLSLLQLQVMKAIIPVTEIKTHRTLERCRRSSMSIQMLRILRSMRKNLVCTHSFQSHNPTDSNPQQQRRKLGGPQSILFSNWMSPSRYTMAASPTSLHVPRRAARPRPKGFGAIKTQVTSLQLPISGTMQHAALAKMWSRQR